MKINPYDLQYFSDIKHNGNSMLISFETRNKLYGILILAGRKSIKKNKHEKDTRIVATNATKKTKLKKKLFMLYHLKNIVSCVAAFFSHYLNSVFVRMCVESMRPRY